MARAALRSALRVTEASIGSNTEEAGPASELREGAPELMLLTGRGKGSASGVSVLKASVKALLLNVDGVTVEVRIILPPLRAF